MPSQLRTKSLPEQSALALLACLAIGSSAACGDDDKSVEKGRDAGQSDASGGDAGASQDPLYILHTATQNAEGTRTNFFTLSSSLTSEQTLAYDGSLELPGRARLYAQPDLGFFALGDSEKLSITRYSLEQDKIVPGESISLQTYGITTMAARAVYFASETKAYYKDADQAQVLVWNPKEMTIERSIELPDDVIKSGYLTGFSDWVARDGAAYFTVSWSTKTYDKVLAGSKLVRIDTATDELVVSDEPRCRGINKAVAVDDTLYFFSDVITAFGNAVYPGEGGQPDCVLRIAAGETTFDASYLGSLSAGLSADQAATVIDVTSDGQAWVQVADLKVAPTEPGTTYNQWYAAGWSWYKAPLANLDQIAAVGGEPGAYSGFTATSGESFLIAQTRADYSETTLVDLSGSAPANGVSFPGFVLGAARLR